MSGGASIAAALVGFQADMPTVHKGKKANVPTKDGRSYSYTYADLADVTAAAVPVLTRHGLAFSALPRLTEHGYELVGTLLHESGESLVGSLPISGRAAQEIGSSLTYLRRYLLGCLTGLVTDDDDDGAAGSTSNRLGDPRDRLAREIYSNAKRAKGLDEIRELWNRGNTAGVLGVDVDGGPLGDKLRELGDAIAAFDTQTADGESTALKEGAAEARSGSGTGEGATPAPGEPASGEAKAAPRPRNTTSRPASAAQHRMLNAVLSKCGVDTSDAGRDGRLAILSVLVGRDVDSSKTLTADEMKGLLDKLSGVKTGAQLEALLDATVKRTGGEVR